MRFSGASDVDQHRGLLGFIRLVLADALVIDNMTLRRTRDGRLVLSFPVRHDRRGRQRPIVWPVSQAARDAIEDAVFSALGLKSAEAGP